MANTNVPTKIREMWTDLYKLFDSHYRMPNTEEAWKDFWKCGKELVDKYEENKRFLEGLFIVCDMISDRMKGEEKCIQESLF